MAPARRMRSSRLASPLEPTTEVAQPANDVTHLPPKPTSLEWVEPHLRPPAPSFRDYPNYYEGNESTKFMKALGHIPTQAEKAKYFELFPNNGRKGARKDVGTREATPGVPRESEPRVSEPRVSATTYTNGKNVDGDYIPTAHPKPVLTKAKDQLPPRAPSIEATKGPARLRGVVESVLKRAEELNNSILGKAVERVWHDSFKEPAIADLIDAVLSQKPTPEQAAEFQHRVKIAKSQIKDAEGSPKQSSTGTDVNSKEPHEFINSKRGSVKRRLETADELSDARGSNVNGDFNNTTMQQQGTQMDVNGTPSKRPAKRTKHCASNASSTSSLTSVSSSELQVPPPVAGDSSTTTLPPLSLSPSDKQQAGPRLHSFPLNNHYVSSNRRSLSSPTQNANDPLEDLAAKRRKLQQTFEVTVNDSEVREPLATMQRRLAKLTQATTRPSRSRPPRTRDGTNDQSLENDLDVESSLSPPNENLLAAPPFPEEQMLTRGTTPTRLGRPPKYARKGARVKMSAIMPRKVGKRTSTKNGVGRPQKNKGVTAGLARPGGIADVVELSEHERPKDDKKDKDNEDNCAACGGTGALLCCDNCVRSFHFTCLEPPQDEHNAPEGRWVCRACIAQEHTREARLGNEVAEDPREAVPNVDGVFGPLFSSLHGKTERSFALPKVVAEAFEGVKIGDTGEYEETALLKNRVRTTADALADLAKFRQGVKKETLLCFACGGSSENFRETGTNPDTVPREMVSCSYCVLNWHLDCLDPPRASDPTIVPDPPPEQAQTQPGYKRRGKKNEKREKTTLVWMCPNHITDNPTQGNNQGVSRAIGGGKIKKIRRPKHATIKDVSLRRGFHNNGLIEVLNDPSDTEKEENEDGVVYRLTEKSIKLDFIDRIRRSNARTPPSLTQNDAKKLRIAAIKRQREQAAAKAEMAKAKAEQEELRKRTFAEQQVALALSQMASGAGSPTQTGISGVDNLIATLIQEAPQDVAGLFAKEETLTEEQKKFLRLAKERIDVLLARI